MANDWREKEYGAMHVQAHVLTMWNEAEINGAKEDEKWICLKFFINHTYIQCKQRIFVDAFETSSIWLWNAYQIGNSSSIQLTVSMVSDMNLNLKTYNLNSLVNFRSSRFVSMCLLIFFFDSKLLDTFQWFYNN